MNNKLILALLVTFLPVASSFANKCIPELSNEDFEFDPGFISGEIVFPVIKVVYQTDASNVKNLEFNLTGNANPFSFYEYVGEDQNYYVRYSTIKNNFIISERHNLFLAKFNCLDN